ncbi:MAG TPA: tetratricopeptide repeat protein [Pyrinomonadaceae bacterium]|nr:tetratricopeptide repeat protein [Pyrinomonadaceae bacterium]
MKALAIPRALIASATLGLFLLPLESTVLAQDVGPGDVGSGIFRPKNPETKKPATKPPATTTPRSRRRTPRTTRTPTTPPVDSRVEELLEQGNQYRDGRRFSEAEQAYQEVLKISARDARAAYGLGNVYTDQHRWEDAERAYRDAVQWEPQAVDALVALSVVLVQPRSGGANARRLVEAETFARRAVQIQPGNAVAWDRLGVAMQSRGLINKDTEHAYRRAVDLDPEFAVAYAHLANVVGRLGRRDEAAQLNERAIKLAKDPPALNLIAESLQAEQQWQNSEPVLKQALLFDPRNPTSLFLMGRMLVVMKRYAEAENYLKTAIEVNPRAFESYNVLGSAYLALERYADAEKIYEKALEFASPGARKQLAGAYGFQGVGDGYLRAKQNNDAARAYRRALELDPENQEIEQKLSRLR